MTFVQFQLSLSTAEEERNYFGGCDQAIEYKFDAPSILPSGQYRVVDGELYRIVPGSAPTSAA